MGYFGPLPLIPRGNVYVLLFTGRFSRRTDMFTVVAAQFTAAGTTNKFIDQHITHWGCPVTLLSDNGLHFTSELARAVYDRLGVNKVNTSACHACTNGGVERVNHVLAPRWYPWSGINSKPIGTCCCHASRRPIATQ